MGPGHPLIHQRLGQVALRCHCWCQALHDRPQLDWAQWRWGLQFLAQCNDAAFERNVRQLVALGRYSHESLKGVVAATGIQYDRLERGILHFFSSQADFEAGAAGAELMRRYGVDRRVMDRDAVLKVEPALAAFGPNIHGGTFTPSDESGDAHKFTRALALRLQEAGVTLHWETEVSALETDSGGRVTGAHVRRADGSADSLHAQAWHVPGHTPADMAYIVQTRDEMAVFVGDTLFMPDYGTARCDFPGGDARALYRSISRLFALPGSTRLFMCHDYLAPGREQHRYQTTVAEQRVHNVHVHQGVDEEAFVAMRQARDASLGMPALMLPSVQVNMRAGQFPPAEDNGVQYLKLPINQF